MGAGSITSNVKSDKKLVVVKTPEGSIETGMKKFGAMLGDEVEVGCGSVLNPWEPLWEATAISIRSPPYADLFRVTAFIKNRVRS